MSEISNKSSERQMSAVALEEARSLVVGAAGREGSVKERLLRAARAFPDLGFSRIRDLFYGDARCRVRADELDYLRRAQAACEKEAAQNEYADLVVRIARLEALLRADPDFFGAQGAAFREAPGLPPGAMDR